MSPQSTIRDWFRVIYYLGQNTISLIGVLTGVTGSINPLPVLTKNIRVQGVSVGPRNIFENMAQVIAEHNFRPVIDRIFPFTEARQALQHLASRKHFGKIVIEVCKD